MARASVKVIAHVCMRDSYETRGTSSSRVDVWVQKVRI